MRKDNSDELDSRASHGLTAAMNARGVEKLKLDPDTATHSGDIVRIARTATRYSKQDRERPSWWLEHLRNMFR